MRGKRTKSKIKIPRLAILIIFAIFIILSVKGIKSILSYPPEKLTLETGQKRTFAENTSPKTHSSKPTSFSKYHSIVENNIFRPLGWEKRKPAPILPVVRRRREIPRERPAPTYTLTLTGIAKRGKEQVALIEDSKEKEGYFLRSGEQLKDCTVNTIESEQIILANAGSEIRLALGDKITYNGSGEIILASARGSGFSMMSGGSRNSASDKPGPSVSEDERLSIIERLKARRKKELNKQ